MKPSLNIGSISNSPLEFLISFVLKSKNNALFFIETSNVKEELWTYRIITLAWKENLVKKLLLNLHIELSCIIGRGVLAPPPP